MHKFVSANLLIRYTILLLCLFTLSACESIPTSFEPFGAGKVDDKPLSLAVRDALKKSSLTSYLLIDVSSQDDVVRIDGFVSNETELQNAEMVASSVPGVRHVTNTLVLH